MNVSSYHHHHHPKLCIKRRASRSRKNSVTLLLLTNRIMQRTGLCWKNCESYLLGDTRVGLDERFVQVLQIQCDEKHQVCIMAYKATKLGRTGSRVRQYQSPQSTTIIKYLYLFMQLVFTAMQLLSSAYAAAANNGIVHLGYDEQWG